MYKSSLNKFVSGWIQVGGRDQHCYMWPDWLGLTCDCKEGANCCNFCVFTTYYSRLVETYNNRSDWIETRAHIIIWLQEKPKNHIRCQIKKTPSIFDENWKPNAKKWKICKLQWKAISKNSQNCTGLKLNFCYQWGVLKTKTPKTPKLDTMGAFFRLTSALFLRGFWRICTDGM